MGVLDEEAWSQWRRQGYVRLRGALPPERVAELRGWIEEVEGWSKNRRAGMHHFEQTDTGPRIARSEDFEPHHAGLSAFLKTGILTDVLGELFGEPAVLFKEKIN